MMWLVKDRFDLLPLLITLPVGKLCPIQIGYCQYQYGQAEVHTTQNLLHMTLCNTCLTYIIYNNWNVHSIRYIHM